VLEQDKRNEAGLRHGRGLDRASRPERDRGVAQFPAPNQVNRRPELADHRYPDLRPAPEGVGKRSLAGTRAAIHTVIRYRNGVLNGKGASLLDGYMEDPSRPTASTGSCWRSACTTARPWPFPARTARRCCTTKHSLPASSTAAWRSSSPASPEDTMRADAGTLTQARRLSEEMIDKGWFNPV